MNVKAIVVDDTLFAIQRIWASKLEAKIIIKTDPRASQIRLCNDTIDALLVRILRKWLEKTTEQRRRESMIINTIWGRAN